MKAVHEKQKPYKCETCNKAFSQRVSRDMHYKRIHGTLEKPHKCAICDMCFAFPAGLKHHMEKGHDGKKPMPKPFFCKVCEKDVLDKAEHIKELHSDGNVQCPKCDRTFKTFNQLGWFEFVCIIYELI